MVLSVGRKGLLTRRGDYSAAKMAITKQTAQKSTGGKAPTKKSYQKKKGAQRQTEIEQVVVFLPYRLPTFTLK